MQCDYVVVGTGSAGSVVANRLSADPGTKVVVLEAGPMDKDKFVPDLNQRSLGPRVASHHDDGGFSPLLQGRHG